MAFPRQPGSNLVNIYVNSLCTKLGPNVIETARGIGCRPNVQSGSLVGTDTPSAA